MIKKSSVWDYVKPGLDLDIWDEDVLNLDYNYVKDYLEKEQNTIVDPLYTEWRREMQGRGIVPTPKEITSSFEKPETLKVSEILGKADEKNNIFEKYTNNLKKQNKIAQDEKIDDVKKEFLEQFDDVDFGWITNCGLKRKIRIADAIFKIRYD